MLFEAPKMETRVHLDFAILANRFLHHLMFLNSLVELDTPLVLCSQLPFARRNVWPQQPGDITKFNNPGRYMWVLIFKWFRKGANTSSICIPDAKFQRVSWALHLDVQMPPFDLAAKSCQALYDHNLASDAHIIRICFTISQLASMFSTKARTFSPYANTREWWSGPWTSHRESPTSATTQAAPK